MGKKIKFAFASLLIMCNLFSFSNEFAQEQTSELIGSRASTYFEWSNWQNDPIINAYTSSGEATTFVGNTFYKDTTYTVEVTPGDTIGEQRIGRISNHFLKTAEDGSAMPRVNILEAKNTKFTISGPQINWKNNPAASSWENSSEAYGPDFVTIVPPITPYWSGLESYTTIGDGGELSPVSRVKVMTNTAGTNSLTANTSGTVDNVPARYALKSFIMQGKIIPQVVKVKYIDSNSGEEISTMEILGNGQAIDGQVTATAVPIPGYTFSNNYSLFTDDGSEETGEGATWTDTMSQDKRGLVFFYTKFDAETHKPTIDPAKEGEQIVTGTGVPGDTITLTDKDGTTIGSGVVGEDGKWTIETTRPLVGKEPITATPTDSNGNSGIPTTETVKELHKATIDPAKDGDKTVTGTGVPGDTITLTDKDGTTIGSGVVGEDGKWTIETTRPLVGKEPITATPTDLDGDIGIPTTETVKELHKATIDPAKDGDKTVTGTGVLGDTITLTDKDGTTIGSGVVGEDGKWTIETTRPLVGKEPITATPTDLDGDIGIPTTETVKELHKATIDPAKDGDKTVTGTGVPGDTITLTDKDGNVLGSGVVGEDGKWTIETTRPLVGKEPITATPTDLDGDVGIPTTETVKELHKATIDPAKDGDKTVTGTGMPGDTITLTDKDGTTIGSGVVGEDGKWTIETTRPLVGKEPITATPTDLDGDIGIPTTETVKELHKATIDPAKDGDKTVTGTGVPGDTITLTDKDGNVLGSGVVGEDGKWTIETTRPLVGKEPITAIPTDLDGDKGIPVMTIVKEATFYPEEHKPTIDPAKDGDKTVTGTGVPGDTITLTDKDGNVLGSGVVGEDGKWTIETTRPLVGKEPITATPTDPNGNTGTSATTIVKEIEDGKPIAGNQSPANTNSNNSSKENKNYPKTNEAQSFISQAIGLLVIFFVFMNVKLKKKQDEYSL